MQIETVSAGAVEIPGQRGKRALEVWRATRRVVPRVADLIAIRRVETQRIAVTIKRSVEGHARVDPVVQGALDDVGIFRLTGCGEHAPVPHHVADGCAAFAIGGEIWELVRIAKSFAIAARSYSTGDVHLVADQVVPERVKRFPMGLIAGFKIVVRCAAARVHGANSMSFQMRA